jgi:MFS family permease
LPPSDNDAPRWRRLALLALGTTFAFNLLGRGSGETYAVFLLPLEREFNWSRSQLTSVYALYLLIGGCIAPLVGTLFDRVGPRVVYAAGLLCLAAANLLASTLTSLAAFYLYIGVLVGVGVALVGMVPASGLLVRWYRQRLSTAIGFAFAAGACGTLLFVPLAQMLLDTLDWRATYRSIGIALLVLAPLFALALPWRALVAGHPEYHGPRQTARTDAGWTLRAALRTRFYWGLAAMFSLTSVAMYMIMPQAVAYFIDSGFSPVVAATAYGLTSVMSLLSLVLTGFLADRMGPRPVISASYLGTVLGIGVLLVMSFQPITPLLVLYVIVFGMCQGVRGPIISSMCAKHFAGPRVATIYGTLYAMNAVGGAIGSLLGGVLHDLTDGYRVGFVLAACVIALAAVPIWAVRELRVFR